MAKKPKDYSFIKIDNSSDDSTNLPTSNTSDYVSTSNESNHTSGSHSNMNSKRPFPLKKVLIIVCSLLLVVVGGVVCFVLLNPKPEVLAQVNITMIYIDPDTSSQEVVSSDNYKYTVEDESEIKNTSPLNKSLTASSYVKIVYDIYNFSTGNYLYRFNFKDLDYANCIVSYLKEDGNEASIPNGNNLDIVLSANSSTAVVVFIRIDNIINNSYCQGSIVVQLSAM